MGLFYPKTDDPARKEEWHADDDSRQESAIVICVPFPCHSFSQKVKKNAPVCVYNAE
jgi:hypothetical protein